MVPALFAACRSRSRPSTGSAQSTPRGTWEQTCAGGLFFEQDVVAKCVRREGRGQGDLKAVANSRNLTVTGSHSAVPWESPVQGVTLCSLLQETGRRQTCGFQTQSETARCTGNLGRRACLFKTFSHVQAPPPTSSWRRLKESERLTQRWRPRRQASKEVRNRA